MKYFFGKGVRKTSRAFCKMYLDSLGNYQSKFEPDPLLFQKFKQLISNLDLSNPSFAISVHGGGISAKQQAICLAMSQAVIKAFPLEKKKLRLLGLGSDFRKKETKKVGQPKARKKKPYVKR